MVNTGIEEWEMIVTKGRVVMYGGHRYRGMGNRGMVVMYSGHRYRGMGNNCY